jgi:pimeloyl-ACP methyl ester carboxylesterase
MRRGDRRPCTLDRCLTELDRILDAALEDSKPAVVFVGHSLGGPVAAAYATGTRPR